MKKIKDDLLHTISTQIADVINLNIDYYRPYEVEIADEQYFNKTGLNNPRKIYIVVKFGEATLNFGQTVFPINIQAISEQDNLEVCYNLLFEFANIYNLKWNEDKSIGQFYSAPTILSSFNEIFEGFRSLLYMSGNFLITKNTNYLTGYFIPNVQKKSDGTYNKKLENFSITEGFSLDKEIFKSKIYSLGIKLDADKKFVFDLLLNKINENFLPDSDNINDFGIEQVNDIETTTVVVDYSYGWQEIDGLTLNTSGDTSLDSQAFYENNGFTSSKAKFATRTLNVTSYLFDNEFLNKCIQIYFEELNIDTEIYIYLKFKNGISLIKPYKLGNLSLQQNIGEMPVVSITLTN